MLANAKRRAQEEGVPFLLRLDDIVIPQHCPVLGIPLRKAQGGFNFNSPSLDRYDPALGYIRSNVTVISMRANMLKKDATIKEIVSLARWMRKRTGVLKKCGGRVYLRGRIWWIGYYVNGRQHRLTSRSRCREDAEALLARVSGCAQNPHIERNLVMPEVETVRK